MERCLERASEKQVTSTQAEPSYSPPDGCNENDMTAVNDTNGNNSDIRVCKFCYSEEPLGEWLSPCKCSGSIKWVHDSCFDRWLQNAPVRQRARCLTCGYVYKKSWELKPVEEWSFPEVKISTFEFCEMALDAYATSSLICCFFETLAGRRSVISWIGRFILWRLFTGNEQRFAFYSNFGRTLASSVIRFTVLDAV